MDMIPNLNFLLFFLATLLCSWWRGVQATGGIQLTPCNIPVPADPLPFGSLQCLGRNYSLPYLFCNVDVVYCRSMANRLMNIYDDYRDEFETTYDGFDTHYNLGVVILKSLYIPQTLKELFECGYFACLFERKKVKDQVDMLLQPPYYMKQFVLRLYYRWFETACSECRHNVLIVAVVDGYRTNRLPVLRIRTGVEVERTWHRMDGIVSERIRLNHPLSDVLPAAVRMIGSELREFYAITKSSRGIGIPHWAYHVFLAMFFIFVMSMAADWMVIRRNAVRQSSSSMSGGGAPTPSAAGGSKKRLMMG